jgi:uncharacterized membrane protein
VYRNALLFVAALLIALTAGRAFWVWLGEDPFAMSSSAYVEFFQQVDRNIAAPIAVTGAGGALLAGLCAFAFRRSRARLGLLAAAFVLGVAASAITVIVNVPINATIATWDPEALPSGYEELLRRWWEWHEVRLATLFLATCAVFAAMLARDSPS